MLSHEAHPPTDGLDAESTWLRLVNQDIIIFSRSFSRQGSSVRNGISHKASTE
jgi:hypothetical protein